MSNDLRVGDKEIEEDEEGLDEDLDVDGTALSSGVVVETDGITFAVVILGAARGCMGR